MIANNDQLRIEVQIDFEDALIELEREARGLDKTALAALTAQMKGLTSFVRIARMTKAA
jgi:hypothetical protein